MLILILYLFSLFITSCRTVQKGELSHSCVNVNDTLVIRFHGVADAVRFKMCEGLEFMLRKGSGGHFEGSFASKDLDDAIFSYDIIAYSLDSAKNYVDLHYRNNRNGDNLFIYHGKNRSAPFPNSKLIKGKIISKDIASKYLGETRKVSIYYPPTYDRHVPIIYLTDGTIVGDYAGYIDTLIADKIIKPVILVGIHSSDDHRYEEYVEGSDDNAYFTKHRDFFIEDVLKNSELEIKDWRGDRYMYGFSNGAAFCMYMGLNYPSLFKEVIAFSTADYISEYVKPIEFKFEKYPTFYMGAGKYEEEIYKDSEAFYAKMVDKDVKVRFKSFTSGHDFNVWKYEFLAYLQTELKYK